MWQTLKSRDFPSTNSFPQRSVMFVALIRTNTWVASWARPTLSFVMWTQDTPGRSLGRAWASIKPWTVRTRRTTLFLFNFKAYLLLHVQPKKSIPHLPQTKIRSSAPSYTKTMSLATKVRTLTSINLCLNKLLYVGNTKIDCAPRY